MKFESDFETLIINPTLADLKEYRIKFTEEFDKLLYLAQTRSYSDDNDYHTGILFEKNNKIYYFHEFENPQQLSYFTTCEESTTKHFFEMLDEYDKINEQNFFVNAKIHYDYLNLNSIIKEKNSSINKKVKL